MALPIKSNSTQDGCNPVSSNCVIWQGPDIPCINLCNGDTVSDVVAKLASELCTIMDALDLTAYDLTCFNPICPTPQGFKDLVQVLIDKICALENITPTPSSGTGCPDDCIVTVATCLQGKDFLGNTITTLSLKDYVIKIGNEICTILTSISTLETNFSDLEARVTYIEENCCSAGSQPTVPSSICVTTGTDIPIVTFVVALETAFCDLSTELGTVTDAIIAQCVDNSDPQLSVYPALTPTMNAILGWNATPGTLAETIENLWLTLCDARTAISTLQTTVTTLQADLAACCAATCSDIIWGFSAQGIIATKNINLYFTGSYPVSFGYCGGATDTAVTLTDAYGNSFVFNEDVLNAISTGAVITLDASSAGTVTEQSVYYEVQVGLCLSGDDISCESVRTQSFYNINWCTYLGASISSPSGGLIQVSWTAVLPSTTYTITLYTSSGVFVDQQTAAAPSVNFTGLTTGDIYKAVIRSTQNGKYIDCETSQIICA